jgi:cystathionine gamma-synthase
VNLHPDTLAVIAGRPPRNPGGPLNAPITPASTYHAGGEPIYGRDGNPGWDALERAVAALEGGEAVAFASGLAAAAAVFDLVPAGGVVVSQRAPYYGVVTELRRRAAEGRIELRELDAIGPATLAPALPGASLVWAETPVNPLLDVVDIAGSAKLAHDSGAILAVDSTFATPLLQSPLALGADLVIHSATKLIGGHSDLLLGVVVAADPDRAAALRERRSSAGATPGALEAYLALRGVRSLPVRLARAQETAAELARRLDAHPSVTRVRYPGRDDHPQRDIVARQMRGGGTIVSFEVTGSAENADALCSACRLLVHTTSLGAVETTLERRAAHAAERAAGTPETLIRMSVGLEHVEDLWRDLSQALGAATTPGRRQ